LCHDGQIIFFDVTDNDWLLEYVLFILEMDNVSGIIELNPWNNDGYYDSNSPISMREKY
jgi:hypothetical protein